MHYDGTNFYCYRKVLDIEGGIKNGNKVITYYKHGGVNQQWFMNSDNTIVSAEGNLAIDICGGNYYPGNNIIAFRRHGQANQKFRLQCQYSFSVDQLNNVK